MDGNGWRGSRTSCSAIVTTLGYPAIFQSTHQRLAIDAEYPAPAEQVVGTGDPEPLAEYSLCQQRVVDVKNGAADRRTECHPKPVITKHPVKGK